MGELLKENMNLHFWSMAFAALRNSKQTNNSVYGEHFTYPWPMLETGYFWRVKKTAECIVMFAGHQTCSAQTEPEALRMMSMHDLLIGSVMPRGKFNVHILTSRLPLQYNYSVRCQIRRPHRMNKQFQKRTG